MLNYFNLFVNEDIEHYAFYGMNNFCTKKSWPQTSSLSPKVAEVKRKKTWLSFYFRDMDTSAIQNTDSINGKLPEGDYTEEELETLYIGTPS